MFESPYRRFVAGPNGNAALGADDLALARLFDGQRSARAVLDAARAQLGFELDAARLEGFAAELGMRGLLRPGRREPMPPPARSDAEAAQLGWLGGGARMREFGDALPPTTVDGTRHGPSLGTGLAPGRSGGWLDREIRAQPFIAFGSSLIGALSSRRSLLILVALLVGAVTAAVGHRLEALRSATGVLGAWRALPHFVVSMALLNLFATSARAAAIARFTPERPRLRLVSGFLGLPMLSVDTAGSVERAARPARLRIVGAAPVAIAMLLLLAQLLWFLTATTVPGLAQQALATMIAAAIALVLRLNPLGQADGYALLANAVDHPDLRRRAQLALFGMQRPWLTAHTKPLPRSLLIAYAALGAAFWIVVLGLLSVFAGGWLTERYGGFGFLFILGVTGSVMRKQYIDRGGDRSTLGVPASTPWWKRWSNWSRRQKIIAGAALVACLMPYHYEPSGSFEVLPGTRADVRALIDGDVREVLVQEGDLVQAGQVIVRLDDAAPRAGLAAAQAESARLQAELAAARRGAKQQEIDVARQKMNTARKTAEVARAQATRLQSAYRSKSVTTQDYERARGAAEVAEQQYLEAQRAFDLVASPVVEERIKALEASVAEADAKIQYQQQALDYTNLTAPIAGRIVSQRLLFARGSFLHRGELLATIEDRAKVLAEIKIPEAAIAKVRLDGEATAKPWAYPGSSFDGHVLSIAPAAEDGPYSRVVRVRVALSDPDGTLRSGMTGNAKVDGGWHMAIVVFSRALLRFVLVELWSWVP